MLYAPDTEAQRMVDGAHPPCVPFREIIVYRHKVAALAHKGVKIKGERRDKRFSLPCFHLGNFAFMQHHPSYKLHVKVAHVDFSLCHLPYGGKRLGKNVRNSLDGGKPFFKFYGKRRKLLIPHGLHPGLKGVYPFNNRGHPFQFPFVSCPEYLFYNRSYHILYL